MKKGGMSKSMGKSKGPGSKPLSVPGAGVQGTRVKPKLNKAAMGTGKK